MTNDRGQAKPGVGLFAKAPHVGQAKTRLCPPLSPESAVRLYAAFLGDLAAMLVSNDSWEWIAYSPDPEALRDAWPPDAPPPHTFRRQVGNDLGDRMAHALAELLEEGRPSAMLLGSDHPTLPPPLIAEAFRALERSDLVLGPTFDGGLYLVGASRPLPGIFDDVPWSTPSVLETVAVRARERRLRIECLTPWYDVDDARGLAFLRAHLAALEAQWGVTAPCPRTRAVLKDPVS